MRSTGSQWLMIQVVKLSDGQHLAERLVMIGRCTSTLTLADDSKCLILGDTNDEQSKGYCQRNMHNTRQNYWLIIESDRS